jgi:hypothetical protein
MHNMLNKKLVLIPTIVLSSALLLTGCTSGNSDHSRDPQNPITSSSAPSNTSSAEPIVEGGYIAPPSEMADENKAYYFAPTTVDEVSWSYYKSIGATTYKEDPTSRSITAKEWQSTRENDRQKFDQIFGENTSDVEQSALNISSYLENNPTATVEEINNNKHLIINRYDKAGSMTVRKDSKTNFYFVAFDLNDSDETGYGILVPQKGITPDFNAGMK